MPEAVWFGGPQLVEIRQEPGAPVGPDDVRVRSLVSGVSAGSELLVYRGSAPREVQPDLPTVRGDFGFPVKFAYASVGRVIEAGSRVAQLAVDDLVFVHHPHQTEYVVPADFPIRLPDGLSADVGVFAANLETAVTVVLDAHPRLGEAVLVTGQGIVGLLITMLLRRTGATLIVTADLHERRRAASIAAGAHHALRADVDLIDAALELTDGRGVDVAIEALGTQANFEACMRVLRPGGTLSSLGVYSSDLTIPLGPFAAGLGDLKIVTTLCPGGKERMRRLMNAIQGGRADLRALVTHRFKLEQIEEAYNLFANQRDGVLKVAITP
jgi:2-desacetyl-2-hydroxyethyl bacteriochlorophyllide A dehydrogenase